jgi:hypothetical protein
MHFETKCYVPGTDRIGYANVEEHFKNVKHYYCDVHAVHDFCLLGGLPTMLNFSLLVFLDNGTRFQYYCLLQTLVTKAAHFLRSHASHEVSSRSPNLS